LVAFPGVLIVRAVPVVAVVLSVVSVLLDVLLRLSGMLPLGPLNEPELRAP